MKLDDYDLSGLSTGKIIQLNELKDQIRSILNFGKYQIVVTKTNPPNWASGPGEMVLTLSGQSANLYVAWSSNVLGGSSNWVKVASALT